MNRSKVKKEKMTKIGMKIRTGALVLILIVARRQMSVFQAITQDVQDTHPQQHEVTNEEAAAAATSSTSGGLGTGDLSTATTPIAAAAGGVNGEDEKRGQGQKQEEQQQDQNPVKDIAIICRSYQADRWKFSATLLTSLQMFFDPTQFDFKLVLDDESKKDHMWGECLKPKYPFMDIQYESNPENWEELFHGIAFAEHPEHAKYARPGYDRQQWSTFYMDKYADPNHEIVGAIDADGTFFTHMTRENILAPDGRILLRVGNAKSHYRNDKVALGIDYIYEFMYPNRMPIFFWKSTLENARAHIAKHYNTTFDEAFKHFSLATYSEFNIIANYALNFEADRYDFKFHTDSEGVVSVGSNYSRRKSVITGCCAAFDIPNCAGPPAPEDMRQAFLQYSTYPVSWMDDMTLVTNHIEKVRRDISALRKRAGDEAFRTMQHECYLYITRRTPSVCTDDIGNITEA
jgi:hypothetical protein